MVGRRAGAARSGGSRTHPSGRGNQSRRCARLALLVLLLLGWRRKRELLGLLMRWRTALSVLRGGETWRMRERVKVGRRGSRRRRMRRGCVVMLLRAWGRKRAVHRIAGLLRRVLRKVVVRRRLREVRLLLLLLLLREPGAMLRMLRVRRTDNLACLGRHTASDPHVGRRNRQHRPWRAACAVHPLSPVHHPSLWLLWLLDHALSLLRLPRHHSSLRRLSRLLPALPQYRLPLLRRHAILQDLLLLLVVRVALLVRVGVVHAG